MQTPPTRDQIALECFIALMGTKSFSVQLKKDIKGDDDLPCLAHNTAVDAFIFADAFLAVSLKSTLP